MKYKIFYWNDNQVATDYSDAIEWLRNKAVSIFSGYIIIDLKAGKIIETVAIIDKP